MLILYIAAPENAHTIDESCQASGHLLHKMIEKRVNLAHTVKTKNLNGYGVFIFDLAAVEDDEAELHSAVYSLQLMYPQIRIVALAFRDGNQDTLACLQRLGVQNIARGPEDIALALSSEGMKSAAIETAVSDSAQELPAQMLSVQEPMTTRARDTTHAEAESAFGDDLPDGAPHSSVTVPHPMELHSTTIQEKEAPRHEPASEETIKAEAVPLVFHDEVSAVQETEHTAVIEAGPGGLSPQESCGRRFKKRHTAAYPVTIGVCGVMRRMGTTTHALGLTAYLLALGSSACCVEGNDSGHMQRFSQYYDVAKLEDGMEVLAGIPLALSGQYPPEGYDYLVYDLGLLDDHRAAFEVCDIKVLCVGSKPWELSWLGRLFQNRPDYLQQAHFIFGFTDEAAREDTAAIMGRLADHTHFAAYTPSFTAAQANFPLYEAILRERR